VSRQPGVPSQVARYWTTTDEGRELMRSLPAVLHDLMRRFRLQAVGEPWPGGWVGYVVPAVRHDGTPAVLKISLSENELLQEADALERWAGNGAVRLLDRVLAPNAMLLERAAPGTSLLDHADRDAAVSIACRVLQRLQVPLAEAQPFGLVTDLARRYTTWIPDAFDRYGRRFDPALPAEATALCAAYAEATGQLHLVNSDFHRGNVLAATREPWLAIDPKPLAGDPAYSTGHLLRDLLPDEPDDRDVGRLVDRLAAELGLDRERVRGWTLVRSVEHALWCLEDDPDGAEGAMWAEKDAHIAACLSRLA
jgi:streptomycin 6-kinase